MTDGGRRWRPISTRFVPDSRTGWTSRNRCWRANASSTRSTSREIVAHQAGASAAPSTTPAGCGTGGRLTVGGLGGDARHRGSVYEGLGARLVPLPESYYSMETLLPMLTKYAPAARGGPSRGSAAWGRSVVSGLLGARRGQRPRVAAHPGRARRYRLGHDRAQDLDVAGQRRQRCVVLARTGTPESRHRGLSMFLVDHDTPGVTVRAIRAMTGSRRVR